MFCLTQIKVKFSVLSQESCNCQINYKISSFFLSEDVHFVYTWRAGFELFKISFLDSLRSVIVKFLITKWSILP